MNEESTNVFAKDTSFISSSGILDEDNISISNKSKPLYFYHLVPKNIVGSSILSPYAMYNNKNLKMFNDVTDKYRDRMCNGWDIYQGRDPKSLTSEEIYNGLIKFRGMNGTKMIYFFKYPPYKELGRNMRNVLKDKDIYRININDPKVMKLIEEIEWGYEGSFTGNKHLDRSYYENVTREDYFKNYNDNAVPLFASINHISIVFKNGILPLSYMEKVDVNSLNEACENRTEARKFVREVGELAKKYDANYFIVTDGASGMSNKGNAAVANARKAQTEWEKKNGFDPNEDWSKESLNESTSVSLSKNDIIRILRNANLTKGEYWLEYGAALCMYGITLDTKDIDCSVTTKLFDKLAGKYKVETAPMGGRMIRVNDALDIFEASNKPKEIRAINGVPVASIEDIKKSYKWRGRDKDLAKIKMIDDFMTKKKSMNESIETLNESVVISGDDISYNLDDWKNGKSNLLVVIGLSGSGKSTLAKQLADKYHADYTCIDEMDIKEEYRRWGKKNDRDKDIEKASTIIEAFLTSHKEDRDKLMDDLNIKDFIEIQDKFIRFAIRYAASHKNQKFILEGIQVIDEYWLNEVFSGRPLIIKGTSVLKSIARQIKRWNSYGEGLKHILKYLPSSAKNTFRLEKRLKYLKKAIDQLPGMDDKKVLNEEASFYSVYPSGSDVLEKMMSALGGEVVSYSNMLTWPIETHTDCSMSATVKSDLPIDLNSLTNLGYSVDGDTISKNIGDYRVTISYDSSKEDKNITFIVNKNLESMNESIEVLNEGQAFTGKLYFLSEKNLDGETLIPRVPNNYMTRNGYEDNTTKRVCFCDTIENCLMAMSKNVLNKRFYVHMPIEEPKYRRAFKKDVPDADLTHEIWVREPVKVKCVGIIVADEVDEGSEYNYEYGDGKKATLYHWYYRWVEKYEEGLDESISLSESINTDYDKILSDIKPMNEKLTSYEYGIIIDNKIGNPSRESDYFNYYRYLSPKEVDKYKGGVCWDLANYQYIHLQKLGYDCKNYYIKFNDDSTHTITVIKYENQYIYLESSFKAIAGIYVFDSLDSIFNFVMYSMFKHDKEKATDKNKYKIYEYGKFDDYGIGCVEFMTKMKKIGKLIKTGTYHMNNSHNDVTVISESTMTIANLSPIVTGTSFLEEKNEMDTTTDFDKELENLKRSLNEGYEEHDFRIVDGEWGLEDDSITPFSAKFCPETLSERNDKNLLNRVKRDIVSGNTVEITIDNHYGKLYAASDFHIYGVWHRFDANQNFNNIKDIAKVINEINSVVGKDDTLVICGDLGYKLDPNLKKNTTDFVKGLKCKHLILVLGNHDLLSHEDYYEIGFERVCDRLNYGQLIFTHYPIDCPGFINIHGHIHEDDVTKYDNINHDHKVKVDYHVNKTPVRISKVIMDMIESGDVKAPEKLSDETKAQLTELHETANRMMTDSLNEQAVYDKEHTIPIFIILMHSGTNFANLIKKATREPFSHAAISLNPTLEPIYEFDRIGFHATSRTSQFFEDHPDANFAVYVVFLTKKEYMTIVKNIDYFMKNKNRMTYDTAGAVLAFMNINSQRKYSYFCSSFVAKLLGDVRDLDKKSGLYLPMDLSKLDYVTCVNGGKDIRKYDTRTTLRNLDAIRRGQHSKIVLESYEDTTTMFGDGITSAITDNKMKEFSRADENNKNEDADAYTPLFSPNHTKPGPSYIDSTDNFESNESGGEIIADMKNDAYTDDAGISPSVFAKDTYGANFDVGE